MNSLINLKYLRNLYLPSIEQVLNTEASKRVLYLRFYNPISKGEWLVCGADLFEKDARFYGIVVLNNQLEQYFLLSELRKLRLPFDMNIEWDRDFKPVSFSSWIYEN